MKQCNVFLVATILSLSGLMHLRASQASFHYRRKNVKKNGNRPVKVTVLPESDCEYDFSDTTVDKFQKDGIKITHFHAFVLEKLRTFAKENDVNLKWLDTKGERMRKEKDKNKKELLKYKVEVTSGETHYGKATRCRKETITPREEVLIVCNQKDKPLSIQLPMEFIKTKGTMTWRVDNGLIFGNKTVSFKTVPPNDILSDHSRTSILLAGPDVEKNFNVYDIYNVTHALTVDPNKMLTLKYISKREKVEIPYTTELILEGHVLAAFDNKIFDEESKYIPFPVSEFESDDFHLREDGSLIFNITGVFKGARHITLETLYKEFDLKEQYIESYSEGSKLCDYNL